MARWAKILRRARSRGRAGGEEDLAATAWARAKSLASAALDLPEAERESFVIRAAAGEPMLEREVATLLASEREARDLWETPAAEILAGPAPDPDPPPAARLPAGTRLGTYEIVSFVSAGGMGEVYAARDTVLGRKIALKVVAAGATDGGGARRLVREARHASRLGHPGICTIHEVGDEGGIHFIAMQFVEGRRLSDVVRERALDTRACVAIGECIADAVDHAHERGIVHRDLKSGNVILQEDGTPVILDFGIAKRLPEYTADGSSESTVTSVGTMAGTLTHMAPEVLRGGEADRRSDVWSLGVLLYEMTTGQLPFTGRTPFETSSAILHSPHRRIPGEVPLPLRLVIERCLQKDAAARYQRAAHVRDALRQLRSGRSWWLVGRSVLLLRGRTAALVLVATAVAALGAGAWHARRPTTGRSDVSFDTVAFLPVANATGHAAADVYARGLTDGFVRGLGGLSEARIVAPTSALHLAGEMHDLDSIARGLHADALVTGRLREYDDRVVVDVQLIDAARRTVLWSDTFERSARRVLALQADVVRAISAQLRAAERPEARARLAAVRSVNPDAYEEYLKGEYDWNQRTPQSLDRAVAHFERAVALDPTYAPANAALADCYNQFGTVMVGAASPREYRPRAAVAAIHALEMDPYSAEAHATLGYVYHYDWRWADAEREFRRAIELNPNAPLPRIWYANFLASRGRMSEALAEVYRARALDPYSLIVVTNVGWILNLAHRYAEADRELRYALELDSTYVQARWRLADALLGLGQRDSARAEAARLVRETGRSSPALAHDGDILFHAGDRDGARRILGELLARSRTGYVSPAPVAQLYQDLGDRREALRWFARAFAEHSNWLVYVPMNAGVWRTDARFRALAVRAGRLRDGGP